MADILKEIIAHKLTEVEAAKEFLAPVFIKALAEKKAAKPKGFIKAIQKKQAESKPALIAEVKKQSPSKGIIREDFNHMEIARAYENAGAACVSILTDNKYFGGKNEFLTQIRRDIALPILRKDFMVDEYQIYESRSLGADCVLLIIAALEIEKAKELEKIAHDLGMDVLIEIHDEQELDLALQLKSKLIGVNNRNLKTMEVSLETGKRVAKLIPADYVKVCESGIKSNAELNQMFLAGYQAFLVGESLMSQKDIEKATRKILNVS